MLFGDDTDLWRDGDRVLDGSLGGDAGGEGDDYLDGGEGDDVVSGGDGSDLLVGGAGNDDAFGEGRDTPDTGGARPPLSERLLACNPTTRVVRGMIDLDGDLLAGGGGDGHHRRHRPARRPRRHRTASSSTLDTGGVYEGLLGSDVVVVGGQVDLDRDGDRRQPATPASSRCLDARHGRQRRRRLRPRRRGRRRAPRRHRLGLPRSAGDGTDLADGGDGNDLVLGDDGIDVLLGGPHDDVLVGGLGDDHLQGANGDDRLHGNEGADDLVGGSDASGADDGQDVLLGGREDDVLVAENGAAVSGGDRRRGHRIDGPVDRRAGGARRR